MAKNKETEFEATSSTHKLNWLRTSVLGANAVRATTRVVLGGALAMTVTYFIGKLFAFSGI